MQLRVRSAPACWPQRRAAGAVSPAYAVDLTSTASAGLGHIAATPTVVDPPATSNLSHRGGADQAATDLAGTATGGSFQAVARGGSAHLVVDADGYFASYQPITAPHTVRPVARSPPLWLNGRRVSR